MAHSSHPVNPGRTRETGRKYGAIYLRIWSDPEWLSYSATAKLLWLRLISSPEMTMSGCVTMTLGRWANHINSTPAEVEAALRELAANTDGKPWLYVDPFTEEVLIRSYIRHDGAYQNRNRRVALERSIAKIQSDTLRDIATAELANLLLEAAGEGTSEAASEVTTEAPCEYQITSNQITSNQTTTTTGNSQLGGSAEVVVVGGLPLPPNAAQAIRLYAEHCATSSPTRLKNPVRYTNGVIRNATKDYGAALLAYLDFQPDATPAQLARDVLHLTEVDLYRLGVA